MGKITVVGSYVVDLMARTPHMPKPGETVLGGPFKMGPGGKGGNQAVAAARLGADVTMVTKIGKDDFGRAAKENFIKENINTNYIVEDEKEATGAAIITVDQASENMIVVALGACGLLTEKEVQQANEEIKNSHIVLVQLETNIQAVIKTIEIASDNNIPIILNPAPIQEFPKHLLPKISYITPNETEASQLTGVEVRDEVSAIEAAEILYKQGVSTVIITLGKKGCLLYNKEIKGQIFTSFKVNAIDTTGAGDAFNGGLAYGLSSGHTIKESITYGNATAALSVTKEGTSPAMPNLQEVQNLIRNNK